MIQSFAKLHDDLAILLRKQRTLLLGIDGCGGSGKSTFARALQQSGGGVAVVHMDDFYLPSIHRWSSSPQDAPDGANFDWQRLRREVLLPLASDEPARFQRYDWPTDALAEWVGVGVGGMVVIEGVCSTRAELRHFYEYRVFVDCPRDVRIARGVARDGESARERWEHEWCPAEEAYIQRHAPQLQADLIVDGEGREGLDAEREFIALDAAEFFGGMR